MVLFTDYGLFEERGRFEFCFFDAEVAEGPRAFYDGDSVGEAGAEFLVFAVEAAGGVRGEGFTWCGCKE